MNMFYDKIYIGGEWVISSGDDYIEVENPANKEIIGRVPASSEEDVNRAVATARQAFDGWSQLTLDERINYMAKILDELNRTKDEMARVISLELGATAYYASRVHTQSYLDEIDQMLELVKDYEFEEKHRGYLVKKEGVGVVAGLTPWNYPLGQIVQKFLPALLAGNCLVLKPSQITPLSAYVLTQAIDRAGLPAGVFNLVPGRGSEVGNLLASHRDVDMVSFTGSTEGGRAVGKLAMEGIKKISLELGGKSPAILLKGADYKLAVKRVLGSIFSNSGQSCSALSRFLIPREDLREVEELIIEISRSFVVGDPQDPKSRLGPLASKKQFDKVSGYVKRGLEEGARLLVGDLPKDSQGYYVEPVVFTDVKNSMTIAREERFGPVLTVLAYGSLEEAVEFANDTNYGLSSAVFGEEKLAMEVASRIRAGEVIINSAGYQLGAPFGGYKESGIGREGGLYGLEEFLEIKTIFMGKNYTL